MQAFAPLSQMNNTIICSIYATISRLLQLTISTIAMSPNHKDIYVKAFSTLRMGLPIFEPSIDVQLGDIGFMDEIDGLFHKLYNVAEPPVDIHGCPPAVNLVKGEPRYERLEAIRVSFTLFLLAHFPQILVVEAEFDKGIILLCKCVSRGLKYRKSGWKCTFLFFRPLASMGNDLEMGFTFAGVHGRESILIPGQFIIKECLEELGCLWSIWPLTINGSGKNSAQGLGFF